MLAPLFDEVEERFSVYVFELRQILKLHNLPIGGEDAVPAIADSLAKSPHLRLDMARMMRAMIRREREQISSVELLSVLMRATGHSPAAHAHAREEAAIDELLGFILAVRYPHEAGEKAMSPVLRPAEDADSTGSSAAVVAPSFDLAGASLFEKSAQEDDGSRKRIMLVAACVAVLGLVIPIALHERGESQKPVGVTVSSAASAGAPAERMASTIHERSAEHRGWFGSRSASVNGDVAARVVSADDTADVANAPVVGQEPAHAEATGDSMRVQPVRVGTNAPQGAETPGVGEAAMTESTAPAIVPVDLRIPMGSARGAGVHANGGGFVHAASAGIMAGNVISSPAPAYPAEAFSAGVQGEVKVQAVVGRDGIVTEARVVSGPPLLREAAVQAVEQWQYRPYLVDGKPAVMATTAIVEFKLPQP